jgi:hypothetical protein
LKSFPGDELNFSCIIFSSFLGTQALLAVFNCWSPSVSKIWRKGQRGNLFPKGLYLSHPESHDCTCHLILLSLCKQYILTCCLPFPSILTNVYIPALFKKILIEIYVYIFLKSKLLCSLINLQLVYSNLLLLH